MWGVCGMRVCCVVELAVPPTSCRVANQADLSPFCSLPRHVSPLHRVCLFTFSILYAKATCSCGTSQPLCVMCCRSSHSPGPAFFLAVSPRLYGARNKYH